jgi:hypothetical protein
VVDSPSDQRLTANGAQGWGSSRAYGIFMNIGLTLGSSIPFWLREHDGNGAMVSASGE